MTQQIMILTHPKLQERPKSHTPVSKLKINRIDDTEGVTYKWNQIPPHLLYETGGCLRFVYPYTFTYIYPYIHIYTLDLRSEI